MNDTTTKIDIVFEPYNDCVNSIVNEGFINPESDNPVRIQDIMPYLDLEFLRPVLNEMSAEDWRFSFDAIPMLKTMIYWRLSDKKFLTQIFNDLLTDPTLADNLGFEDIPDYKALYHCFITGSERGG